MPKTKTRISRHAKLDYPDFGERDDTVPSPLRLFPPQKVVGSNQIAPLLYKLDDVAHMFSVSRSTVDRWIRDRRLSALGRGKLRRVPYDAIQKLLDELRRESEAS